MKKQYSVLLISFLSIVALSAGIKSAPHAAKADLTCHHVGYHYASVSPTSTTYGHEEFWACCKCHEIFLETPESGDWTTQSDELMTGGLASDHPAYIAPSSSPAVFKILFQGDSITDADRSRYDLTDLGNGYARMVGEHLDKLYSETYDFEFVNRAESGWNLVGVDQYAFEDKFNDYFYTYSADLVTFFIGTNDIMDYYGTPNQVSDAKFESVYRDLCQGLKDRGSDAILIAPFCLNYASYGNEFANKSTIVQNLATEFGFGFISIKDTVEQALEDGAYQMELFGDLLHPSYEGCKLIASLVQNEIKARIDSSYVKQTTPYSYSRITSSESNDDLTNQRIFGNSSLGDFAYDYEVTSTLSSASLRMENKSAIPAAEWNAGGAYSQVIVDFSALGTKNITQSNLEFDVKADNLAPWTSIIVRSGYDTKVKAYSSTMSTEYGIDLTNKNVCADIGNGWKHINLNLASVFTSNADKNILSNAVGIIFSCNKGDTNEIRTKFGVDSTKTSYMWFDNLHFVDNDFDSTVGVVVDSYIYSPEVKPYLNYEYLPTYDSRTSVHKLSNSESFSVGGWPAFRIALPEVTDMTKNTVSLDIKVKSSNPFIHGFALFDSDVNKLTDNTFEANYGMISAVNDTWVSFTFDCSTLAVATAVKYIQFCVYTPELNDEFYLDNVVVEEKNTSRGIELNLAQHFGIGEFLLSSDTTYKFDFKFTSAEGTDIDFILVGGGGYVGYFSLYYDGSVKELNDASFADEGDAHGISTEILNDGYIQVTITFNSLTKFWWGLTTSVVNEIWFNADSSTGAGLIYFY